MPVTPPLQVVSALEFARQAQIAANQAFLASIDRVFDSGEAETLPNPTAHLEALRTHAKQVALEASAQAATKQHAEAHSVVAYRTAGRKRRRAWCVWLWFGGRVGVAARRVWQHWQVLACRNFLACSTVLACVVSSLSVSQAAARACEARAGGR